MYTTPVQGALGTKQLPLLHLVYEICTALYAPQARKVRASWLAKRYSEKTGKELTPRLVDVSEERAQKEFHHLVGMLLSQRPYFLPIWAQLDQERQLKVAEAIVALLQGEPLEEGPLSLLTFELFKGALYQRTLQQVQELEQRMKRMEELLPRRTQEMELLRSRQALTREQIARLEEDLLNNQARQRLVQTHQGELQQEASRLRAALPKELFGNGDQLLSGDTRLLVIDLQCDTPEEEKALLDQIAEYEQLQPRWDNLVMERDGLQQEQVWLQGQRQQLVDALGRSEKVHDRIEELLLSSQLIQLEWIGLKEDATDLTTRRQELQLSALKMDHALQQDNYVEKQDFDELRVILEESGTSRQLFLFMHPALKYIDDKKTRCRIVKFLGSAEVLEAFQTLDEANLIQPGPHAKLGVFVINALTPGSYDQRHRELVQEELQQIVEGMLEHGMDPEIRCHSCGTQTPSGRSEQEARTSWIRDHNPPTALYKLTSSVYTNKLGLPDYNGNGVTQRQILLPQCRECSKRQGAVTSKAVELIESPQVQQELQTNPHFDLLNHIKQTWENQGAAGDWEDFQRLVCNPMAGWSSNMTRIRDEVDLSRLVTTGSAGSFSGIDETLLQQLGAVVGCHTCTDELVQNDPFRNISWIADHQPPTALVERGLMELPQLVYPHCWRCSEDQAQRIRALTQLFDGCFGKEFKLQWIQNIRDNAYDALTS